MKKKSAFFGMALALFIERKGRVKCSLFPFIERLVEEEILISADYYFALKFFEGSPEIGEDGALLMAFLLRFAREGHLCIPLSSFPRVAEESGLQREIEERLERAAVVLKNFSLPIVFFEDRVYLKRNWETESLFLERLLCIHGAQNFLSVREDHRLSALTDEQRAAAEMPFSHPVTILTGGPGTGKTHTAIELVKAYSSLFPDHTIALCAPTGKAAARLKMSLNRFFSQESNVRCSTLHALLRIKSYAELFSKGPSLSYNLIIIDECSMIDAPLFCKLLASIPEKSRLLLMGDAHQLPPVEMGNFFSDLVLAVEKKPIFPHVHLTHCLRSDRKELLDLARAVCMDKGEEAMEALSHFQIGLEAEELFALKRHFFFPTKEPIDPPALLKHLEAFKLLSVVRQGRFGVDGLNQFFLDEFLRTMQEGEWLAVPIMIEKNDYENNLYNGDVGILIRHNPLEMTSRDQAYFLSDSTQESCRTFPFYLLPSYAPAYCLSVHKSQGSEYGDVALVVPPGSEAFGRELLYTAITRARSSFKLYGDGQTVRALLKRRTARFSSIETRLCQGIC